MIYYKACSNKKSRTSQSQWRALNRSCDRLFDKFSSISLDLNSSWLLLEQTYRYFERGAQVLRKQIFGKKRIGFKIKVLVFQ